MTSLSVLLNASHHKERDYVWLRVGDQDGFGNFLKCTGWGMPGHTSRGHPGKS